MKRSVLPSDSVVLHQDKWPKRWLDKALGGHRAPAPEFSVRVPDIDLRRIGHLSPASPDAVHTREEFRIIKRSVLAGMLDRSPVDRRDPRVILVSSAVPGEGKSFVAQNLAMSLAIERELAVTLIDGDVADQSLTHKFGKGGSKGLLGALHGSASGPQDVSESTNIENLEFVPAGTGRSDASELISSERMGDFIGSLLRESANRVVVIDSGSLLSGSTPIALASHAGQFVFVIAAGETRRNDIDEALTLLDAAVGPLENTRLGLVLNYISSAQSAARYSANRH